LNLPVTAYHYISRYFAVAVVNLRYGGGANCTKLITQVLQMLHYLCFT